MRPRPLSTSHGRPPAFRFPPSPPLQPPASRITDAPIPHQLFSFSPHKMPSSIASRFRRRAPKAAHPSAAGCPSLDALSTYEDSSRPSYSRSLPSLSSSVETSDSVPTWATPTSHPSALASRTSSFYAAAADRGVSIVDALNEDHQHAVVVEAKPGRVKKAVRAVARFVCPVPLPPASHLSASNTHAHARLTRISLLFVQCKQSATHVKQSSISKSTISKPAQREVAVNFVSCPPPFRPLSCCRISWLTTVHPVRVVQYDLDADFFAPPAFSQEADGSALVPVLEAALFEATQATYVPFVDVADVAAVEQGHAVSIVTGSRGRYSALPLRRRLIMIEEDKEEEEEVKEDRATSSLQDIGRPIESQDIVAHRPVTIVAPPAHHLLVASSASIVAIRPTLPSAPSVTSPLAACRPLIRAFARDAGNDDDDIESDDGCSSDDWDARSDQFEFDDEDDWVAASSSSSAYTSSPSITVPSLTCSPPGLSPGLRDCLLANKAVARSLGMRSSPLRALGRKGCRAA